MSFLELEPAARRLRQVAKAHAAGEIPRHDYRRVRRKIIEDLHIDFTEVHASGKLPIDRFSLGDDDTRRRVSDEFVSSSVDQPMETESPEARNWPKVVVALVCLILVFGGLATSASSIPPVRERDPNPKNSLTLSVRTLEIANFEELPGIHLSELEALLSALIADARSESGASSSNQLSQIELSEFGDLLVRLGVRSDQGLDETAVTALNALAQRQRTRRGVSVVQLERAAEQVERFYRDRGYLAARVFVPAQTVTDERVILQVLPGRIARIDLDSTNSLSKLARQSFDSQLGQAAKRSSLESSLYRLNDLPGVRASGNLSAGDRVGETVLNLSLENQRKFVSRFTLDNLGDERSSRYRLQARTEWRNPLERGDNLVLTGALKVRPEEATEFGVSYTTPGLKLGDTLSASIYRSDFAVLPRFLEDPILADASTIDFGFKRLLVGSRIKSISVGAHAAAQLLDFSGSDQTLWWIAPEVEAHKVFDRSRWVLRGATSLTAGHISSGTYAGQPAEFIRGWGSLWAWKPIGRQSIRIEMSGQLGSRDLPDSQKFRLGGDRRISGIRPGSFTADSAFVAGIGVTATPASWRQFGELELSTRIGQGHVHVSQKRESAFAWDGGVSWRLPQSRQISGALRLSVPLLTSGIEDSHDRARVLFDLSWRP